MQNSDIETEASPLWKLQSNFNAGNHFPKSDLHPVSIALKTTGIIQNKYFAQGTIAGSL